MSGRNPDGPKTDFGPFLRNLRPLDKLGAAQADGDVDLQGAAVRALAKSDKPMPIDALLEPPFTSIGLLTDVIKDLLTLGLAEMTSDGVQLTASGKALAKKADAAPRTWSPFSSAV